MVKPTTSTALGDAALCRGRLLPERTCSGDSRQRTASPPLSESPLNQPLCTEMRLRTDSERHPPRRYAADSPLSGDGLAASPESDTRHSGGNMVRVKTVRRRGLAPPSIQPVRRRNAIVQHHVLDSEEITARADVKRTIFPAAFPSLQPGEDMLTRLLDTKNEVALLVYERELRASRQKSVRQWQLRYSDPDCACGSARFDDSCKSTQQRQWYQAWARFLSVGSAESEAFTAEDIPWFRLRTSLRAEIVIQIMSACLDYRPPLPGRPVLKLLLGIIGVELNATLHDAQGDFIFPQEGFYSDQPDVPTYNDNIPSFQQLTEAVRFLHKRGLPGSTLGDWQLMPSGEHVSTSPEVALDASGTIAGPTTVKEYEAAYKYKYQPPPEGLPGPKCEVVKRSFRLQRSESPLDEYSPRRGFIPGGRFPSIPPVNPPLLERRFQGFETPTTARPSCSPPQQMQDGLAQRGYIYQMPASGSTQPRELNAGSTRKDPPQQDRQTDIESSRPQKQPRITRYPAPRLPSGSRDSMQKYADGSAALPPRSGRSLVDGQTQDGELSARSHSSFLLTLKELRASSKKHRLPPFAASSRAPTSKVAATQMTSHPYGIGNPLPRFKPPSHPSGQWRPQNTDYSMNHPPPAAGNSGLSREPSSNNLGIPPKTSPTARSSLPLNGNVATSGPTAPNPIPAISMPPPYDQLNGTSMYPSANGLQGNAMPYSTQEAPSSAPNGLVETSTAPQMTQPQVTPDHRRLGPQLSGPFASLPPDNMRNGESMSRADGMADGR